MSNQTTLQQVLEGSRLKLLEEIELESDKTTLRTKCFRYSTAGLRVYIIESCIGNDIFHKFDVWYIVGIKDGNIVYAAKTIYIGRIESMLERLEFEQIFLKPNFPFGVIGLRNLIEEAFVEANIFSDSYMDGRFKILYRLIITYKRWLMLSL